MAAVCSLQPDPPHRLRTKQPYNVFLGKSPLIVCRTDELVAGVLGYEDFLPLTQEGHGLQVSSGVKNKEQLPVTYS